MTTTPRDDEAMKITELTAEVAAVVFQSVPTKANNISSVIQEIAKALTKVRNDARDELEAADK